MYHPYEQEVATNSYPIPTVDQNENLSIFQIDNFSRPPAAERSSISKPSPNPSANEIKTKPIQLNVGPFEPITVQIWEGYVDHVGEESFFVKFVDVNDEFQSPKFQAEFDKSDLSIQDLNSLEIGSLIKWEIKEKYLPTGIQKESYSVSLIRLPEITKDDIEKALVETEQLLERLGLYETKAT